MIKNIYFFAMIFIFSTAIFAQDLPNNLTKEEVELLKTYIPPQPIDGITTPPSFTPRTMAEWEELQGIMITWTSYTNILSQIVDYAQDEGIVFIVCSDSNSVKSYLTSQSVPLFNLKFLIEPYNTIWCRDYGPWTIYKDDSDSLSFVDWIYNRPRPYDDILPQALADYIGIPIYQTTQSPNNLVHTGGNFMNDGHGTGFSSKLILNENPTKTEAEIDAIMNSFMGIDRFIKMNNLPYDVIHHIDMHIKLLDEETLLVGEYPPGISDGPQIEANLQYILNNFQTCFGRDYKVVRIPMPPDQSGLYPSQGGDYRTYTNSIIINKTVIIPTYQYQYDTTAFRIYREAMPGYNIVGINSNSIIPQLGAIHCITKEIGAFNPIFISHGKLRGPLSAGIPIPIEANINTPPGISSASLFWSVDTTTGFQEISMTNTGGDLYEAVLPSLPAFDTLFYYISASASGGKTITKPMTAPSGAWEVEVSDYVPVELISFSANVINNAVNLIWQTATETNNQGFEIERNYAPLNPLPGRQAGLPRGENNDWQVIGFIEGYGTTSEIQNYSFIDEQISSFNSKQIFYRLKQIDFDGSFNYSDVLEITIPPSQFSLEQNYPNPFNPSTTIKFSIPERSFVSLKVFDMLGREVRSLINEVREAGEYSIEFEGRNLASGMYIYQLNAGSYFELKKMVLMK